MLNFFYALLTKSCYYFFQNVSFMTPAIWNATISKQAFVIYTQALQ